MGISLPEIKKNQGILMCGGIYFCTGIYFFKSATDLMKPVFCPKRITLRVSLIHSKTDLPVSHLS